jgi:hypothetical protein
VVRVVKPDVVRRVVRRRGVGGGPVALVGIRDERVEVVHSEIELDFGGTHGGRTQETLRVERRWRGGGSRKRARREKELAEHRVGGGAAINPVRASNDRELRNGEGIQ